MSSVIEAPLPSGERVGADIDALAALVEPDTSGWTRRVFSDADAAGRDFVLRAMSDAGLETCVDPVGNVVGLLRGWGSNRAAIVTGSHADTVLGGGRFDGIVGVVGAIEVVRSLREAGVSLQHDLRVVCFMGEETNAHGVACLGSRAATATLERRHLELVDDRDRTLGSAMEASGFDVSGALACGWRPAEVAAFVELHVEQGALLERIGRQIGIVSRIVGVRRLRAHFSGRLDHSGTTPMADRRDACCAAAEAVLAVERVGRTDGVVATTGGLRIDPSIPNAVPSAAVMNAEIRSAYPARLERGAEILEKAFTRVGVERDIGVELSWMSSEAPRAMSKAPLQAITEAVDDLGYRGATLVSGAGHDACLMAALAPTAMVFVPSRDGRSHCPEEFTDLDDIVVGVHVLTQAVLRLDQA